MGLVYGHHVWVVFIKVGRPHVAHVDHDVGLGGGLLGCDDRWLLHQWVAPTPWPAVHQGAVVSCALAEYPFGCSPPGRAALRGATLR